MVVATHIADKKLQVQPGSKRRPRNTFSSGDDGDGDTTEDDDADTGWSRESGQPRKVDSITKNIQDRRKSGYDTALQL